MTKAFISGCSGLVLTPEEQSFFASEDPWGLILFRRNIEAPEQVKQLIADFRSCVKRPDAPVLVDQEGGRVQRLRPPHWPVYPPGEVFGRVFSEDREAGLRAVWLGARLIAHDLLSLGITVDCLPLLDLRFSETVDAIGDRAFAGDPEIVGALGKAQCEGLMAGGVLPIIKHIPGHGRALVDSHLELPRVSADRNELSGTDFAAFRPLAGMPLAMTAHILYESIDADNPATQSLTVIGDVIRGDIGFDGCLMGDDISMHALGGDMQERAALSFAAGCDLVLHCNGDMNEMRAVAEASPKLAGKPLERSLTALAMRQDPAPGFDAEAARAEFERMIANDTAGTV